MSRFAYALIILLLALGAPPALDAQQSAETAAAPLLVTEVLPGDGSSDIEIDAVITAIFNHPIIPLGITEDAANRPDPLTFDPPAAGRGEWLNTSIYVFRPEPALAGGTTYTVTVAAGLQAVDGAALAEPFTWTFSTTAPEITSVVPNVDRALPDTSVQVTFNQPMDHASTEAAFFLRPPGQMSGTLAGAFAWADDSASFAFTPAATLTLDTVYAAGFREGARPAAGGAPLDTTRWEFTTIPLPGITGTEPFDGQTDVYPWGGFRVYFASPMNIETLSDRIVIEPEPWRAADYYYSEWDNSYSVNFPMEPSTEYTVTLLPGMADIYGNVIDQKLVAHFTTSPLDPDISLQVPGPVGFYNAYNDDTRLFLKHRNISRLDLSLYRLDVGDFMSRLFSDSYDPAYDYDPPPDALLRSWQIESDTPLNQTRYELLELGGSASVDCAGALPARVKIGDSAVVVTGPDPLRARATPPDGEVLDLLYRDYRLEITGGPTCADGALWWEVQLRGGSRAWIAEGIGDEYFIDVQAAGVTTPVTVSPAEGGALAPGAYFLQVGASELADAGYNARRHILVVSTASLTVKATLDTMLVWAVDAHSGLPIAGAPITVYGTSEAGNIVIGAGVTDADGLLRLDLPPADNAYQTRVAVLQTAEHFGMAATAWTSGIEPYQFGMNFDYYPARYRIYLYSDRPVYRPGQPVYFRGVVRLRDDVTFTPPAAATVPVVISDSEGDIIYTEELPLTRFGTFSGVFEISDDARLGYYNLSVQISDEREYAGGANLSFGVAEYRVPEFQVEVTPDADAVVQGETIRVLVESAYFFGGSVSAANVDYAVQSTPYFFNYDGPGYYDFTDFNYDAGPAEYYDGYGQQVASGSGTTDAAGRFIIEVPADLKDSTQSLAYTIEATVRDESGLTVSGRAEVVVHKGLVYIGARPASYVGTAGREAEFEIIAVDWDSAPVSGQAVDVEVVERRWFSVQEQDEAGRTTWTWDVEELPVAAGSVTSGADGKATFTFTPPNGGVFKAKISTRDARGNPVNAATTLWVAGEEYVSWRQQNSNRVDLIADNTDYAIGDTAQILITSPFQGSVEALVTVERGDVLRAERITLDSNSYVYELPITADLAPNVFVSVLLIKGVDDSSPTAAFRMGTVALGVDNSRKVISIDIAPDREQAGPRDTVTYTITTTDYQGAPVQAEVGVALTDLAVLSIADSNSGPILNFFYGEQGLGVLTATPLTINTDQITQTVIDTIKGGGGGGGEGGIFDIRQEFVDTPYWNAEVVTGADGQATISVILPDNLTTWRLDARAVTSGADGLTLVGQDTFDLLSTKPLLIRPVTPRFFVVGDEVVLAAVVNNNTDAPQDVEVTMQGAGFTFTGAAAQRFTIPAGGRQRVEWPVTVDDVQAVDLTFFVSGGAYTDASKPPLGQGDARLLPVYRYEVPETVGTGGLLREGGSRTEAIALPTAFEVTQGALTVNLEPSLAATTLAGLDYLENFPHQCTEQTVSRFLPNIMTFSALDRLGVADAELEASLNTAVNFALQRLYAQQRVDGGWGWFVQDRSSPLTTAYALIGLAEARAAGFAVADSVIEGAQGFLRTTFIVPGLDQPAWQLNRQAFTLYALARSGAPDVARSATLFESRARLDYYAKAFLALTFNLIDPADTARTDTLLSDLINGATLSANGAFWDEAQNDYWNWNTNTRTAAVALAALVKLRPQSDLIPNVVRWLMVARQADVWETTQETAWAVMALTDWMETTGELNPDYTYTATLNGAALAAGAATPDTVRAAQQLVVEVGDLLRDQANLLTIERSAGPGVLYYTAYLRVFLPVPEIEPLNQGVVVERHYTRPGDDTPITEARVGELVQVRLTIIAPTALHFAVIEDPIPAGAQAVNPDLSTEQQIGTRPSLDSSDPLSRGWGWWWFSNTEFRDEKVVLYSTYLPAGAYEYVYTMRAGLPGVYNVIPPVGYQFYLPEVYGRGAGSVFTVLPAE